MAEILPLLLPEAAEVLAEVITDVEIETAASSALVDVTGEVISGGADLLTGTTGEGEVVLEPIFDGNAAELNPTDSSILGDVSTATKGQLEALWSNAKAFARWTGQEIMKGAVFQIALDAVIDIIKRNPPPDFATSDLVQVLTALSDTLKILRDVSADWDRWCVRHWSNRDSFGMVIAEDVEISRFEIFRNHISLLTVYLQKTLAPLLATLKKDISGANIGGIRAATKTYASKFVTLAQELQQKEGLMMHAGLQDHITDIQTAVKLMN